MGNDMVARDPHGARHEFANYALRPFDRARQRCARDADAYLLYLMRTDFGRLAHFDNAVMQVAGRFLFAHTGRFAGGRRSLAQQLSPVADSAVRLGASGVYSQVERHGAAFILTTNFVFALDDYY
jgi:hypothetical protein